MADETYTQPVTLSSGEEITVSGKVLRAWGGDVLRQTVERGNLANGAPASGEQLREAAEILNR